MRGKSLLMAACLMLVGVSLVGTASASSPGACRTGESSGKWTTSCYGVDGAGCVGSWGASGTYEDVNGARVYHTTNSWRDTVCPSAGVVPTIRACFEICVPS